MWGDLKSQNDRTVEWQNDGKTPQMTLKIKSWNRRTAENPLKS